MKFAEAFTHATKGRVIRSRVTKKYYSFEFGFLKEALHDTPPSIDEFMGEWSTTNLEFEPRREGLVECYDYTPLP